MSGSLLQLAEGVVAGFDDVEDAVEIHRPEDFMNIGADPEEDDLSFLQVDPSFDRHEEADFRTRQVVHLVQINRKPRIFPRLDQLVQPITLGGLPVVIGFVGRLEGDDQHATRLAGRKVQHYETSSSRADSEWMDRTGNRTLFVKLVLTARF